MYPETFGTVIDSIQVNEETKSLAFRVAFETEGFMTRDQAETSGEWDDAQYAYFYQLNPRRWQAFSIYDLKPKFGTDLLQDLLTPSRLEQVFAAAP